MVATKEPNFFYFDFDWPTNVVENFKHKFEFIIKSNESLTKNKIKNQIEKLLLKYKYAFDIHEDKKQKN